MFNTLLSIFLIHEDIEKLYNTIVCERPKTWRTITNAPILPGTIVRCSMSAIGYHSGIIIGDDEIIELDGSGNIRRVSFKEFKNIGIGFKPNCIEVACNKQGLPYSSTEWANNAILRDKTSTNYGIFLNNCHRFVISCISKNSHSIGKSCNEIEKVIRSQVKHSERIYWCVPRSEVSIGKIINI